MNNDNCNAYRRMLTMMNLHVNGTPAGVNTDTLTYTIYPSPYITINGDRWTKHYYIGSERIASQAGIISSFGDLNIPDNHAAGASLGINISYGGKKVMEEDSIASMYSHFGVPYEVLRTRSGASDSFLHLPISKNFDGEAKAGEASSERQRSHPNTHGTGDMYFYTRDHLGSTLTVTDSVGATVQRVEYTPWGEVFIEQRSTNADYSTPYLFNGKELDEETGLYYYGARYYDPKISVWYSTDPMEMDYPWVMTYGYCMNNPIKLLDFNGEEWYQDEDGTIQYSPKVHSKNDINNRQKYLGASFQNKEQSIFYRNDGSILFKKETEAYNRIWNQANVHYRNRGEKGGREVGAYVLSNGHVLVLPDYLNDNSTAKFNIAGYELKGQKLYKNNVFCYVVIAQIHTHQDKSLPATPSFYMGSGYGDLGVSLTHNSFPVFTIGHDGKIHGIRGYRNNKGEVVGLEVSLSLKESSRYNLLSGVTSLYSIYYTKIT